MEELPSYQTFKKHFKSFKKQISKNEIKPISNESYNHYTIQNPTIIQGYDQSFAMTSFSTYPIFDNIKQGEPNCDSIAILRFVNSTIMIIADGCGWGETSATASKQQLNQSLHIF